MISFLREYCISALTTNFDTGLGAQPREGLQWKSFCGGTKQKIGTESLVPSDGMRQGGTRPEKV
ncbi:MAG: hypothetical protein ACK5IJ_05050 [Mangrovibacterium sp.]